MNNAEMTKRYLYAATKDLPAAMRDDVAHELESLIDDMLAERCGDTEPTAADLQAVLAEIGTPDEVFARYSPDGHQSLIGPPYYTKYKLILKIVLYCVGIAMLVLGPVSLILHPQDVWSAVFNWVGTVLSSLVFGFAAVTILFAVLQRKNVPLDGAAFDFGGLPAVPAKGERISRGDSIAQIVLNVVFTVVFIFFPQLFSFYRDGVGPVAAFNIELLQSRWLLLVIGCVLGLLAACFGMFEGRYTLRYAVVLLACNIGNFIVAVLFLSGPSIMNANFITAIHGAIDSERGLELLANLNIVIIGIIALSLVLECVTAFSKALRSRA